MAPNRYSCWICCAFLLVVFCIKPAMAREEEKTDFISPAKTTEIGAQNSNDIAHDLSAIFSGLGAEWVQTGKHFIPLNSGGEVVLKAVSFPVINLQNNRRIIVDLYNKLPNQMVKMIKSSWKNYRVVRLMDEDDLRSALDRIFKACNYPRMSKGGEPFELCGEIPLRITGDWIVTLSASRTDNRPDVVVINLNAVDKTETPRMIKTYLEGRGVRIIDYPSVADVDSDETDCAELFETAGDPSYLINTVLVLTGSSFSTGVEIPAYQSKSAALNLTIKADYFFKIRGKDAIIDLSGLGTEIISILREQGFLFLSLGGEMKPLTMLAKTLEFLDVPFNPGPHPFFARPGDEKGNIRLTLPGIVFSGRQGKTVFATPLKLPNEIKAFLSERGFEVLVLLS